MDMLKKKSITDFQLEKKRVLLRVDFNLPIEEGKILDDTRILAAIPTIKFLVNKGARTILMTHLGRPKGRVVEELRLDPIAQHLSDLLQQVVIKVDEVIGDEVTKAVEDLKEGEVLLLENIRFHPGEEANDEDFSRSLAKLGDIFLNDAFGTSHRAHASTAGVASYLPAGAGFLLNQELEMIGGIISNPKKPLVAILGGAKITDKIGVIRSLINRVDSILIGGGMANTFLLAQGYEVGQSLVEKRETETAQNLLHEAEKKGVTIYLPEDLMVAHEFKREATPEIHRVDRVPAHGYILDIGPATATTFARIINESKTVVWNGPMGLFEWETFARGTRELVKALAGSGATTVAGGGESVAVVRELGLEREITHLSTGGGAFLKMLEGKELPAIKVLDDKKEGFNSK